MCLHSEAVNPSDGALVRKVLDGDTDAYGVLVTRYRTEFARYATGLCGDADSAADAMQEAFIRAYRSLGSCREPEKFKAWFFRILTNQCHNVRDRRKAHAPLEVVSTEAAEQADDRAIQNDLRRAIRTALKDLTKEQREAFVLKHIEGYTYGEIARLLDEGVDALKMRVYRARDVVKRRLEELL